MGGGGEPDCGTQVINAAVFSAMAGMLVSCEGVRGM